MVAVRNDPAFKCWEGARDRCRNPNNKDYPSYGGRGIKFHSRWDDFLQFLADMGPRPTGKSIDRIDNDGPYAPGNCKWSTSKEQARNRRNASDLNEVAGGHLTDLATQAGITYGALVLRLRRGWSLEKALSTPVAKSQRTIEWRGKRMPMADAARIAGLPPAVVQHRLLRNWTIEDALSRPKGNYS